MISTPFHLPPKRRLCFAAPLPNVISRDLSRLGHKNIESPWRLQSTAVCPLRVVLPLLRMLRASNPRLERLGIFSRGCKPCGKEEMILETHLHQDFPLLYVFLNVRSWKTKWNWHVSLKGAQHLAKFILKWFAPQYLLWRFLMFCFCIWMTWREVWIWEPSVGWWLNWGKLIHMVNLFREIRLLPTAKTEDVYIYIYIYILIYFFFPECVAKGSRL